MIAIIISVISIILLYMANITVNDNTLRWVTGILLVCFSSLLGTSMSEYLTIPSIEVYRGNTELEITYKNNIPIDSVVVWKNK
jgi:hypothetical protein